MDTVVTVPVTLAALTDSSSSSVDDSDPYVGQKRLHVSKCPLPSTLTYLNLRNPSNSFSPNYNSSVGHYRSGCPFPHPSLFPRPLSSPKYFSDRSPKICKKFHFC